MDSTSTICCAGLRCGPGDKRHQAMRTWKGWQVVDQHGQSWHLNSHSINARRWGKEAPRCLQGRERSVSKPLTALISQHGRTTRSGHLCERVKRERVVGRQRASRAERRAELVQ